MKLNCRQICSLIKKDLLVKVRQPWMTILQFLWPCAIFLSLFILRMRFKVYSVDDCQFPSRQLPTNGLLPFIQSYACTFENQCLSVDEYEEITSWDKAPFTAVLNIVHIILNEKELFDSVVELPKTKEFVPVIFKLVGHKKFKDIEHNANKLIRDLPAVRKTFGNFSLDLKSFSLSDDIVGELGKALCGRPFPEFSENRFVGSIIESPDYNGSDEDELEVMPTPYCKQLYTDVTTTNFGKVAWKLLKPFIQGKILYGPASEMTNEIVAFGNKTFEEANRLREFVNSLATSFKLLKTDKEFRANFDKLLELAKSPIVQAIIGGTFDTDAIGEMITSVINDKSIAQLIDMVPNILECFSVDRFVPVKDEQELEDLAHELARKKLFYAGLFFSTDETSNETSYKLRMEVENTPKTSESKSRFWFPGPEGSFVLQMRYHRSFIQIQNFIDTAIIKYHKKKQFDETKVEEDPDDFDSDSWGEDEDFSSDTATASKDELPASSTQSTVTEIEEISSIPTDATTYLDPEQTDEELWKIFDTASDAESQTAATANDNSQETTTTSSSTSRKKRQLSELLSSFGSDAPKKKSKCATYEIDDMQLHTRQFPYTKYTRDNFKTAMYIAQLIQILFFFALIIHIASSVREKIWFKESGNLFLMRTMGLRESSELISWTIVSFVELAIVFLIAEIILYNVEVLRFSGSFALYVFLLIFVLAVISFCFMASTFFSSASIGSVSAVILFLMTFLPYIIIVSLGTVLSSFGKLLASLSLSTAFCYAWQFILRLELQEKPLSFAHFFAGDFLENDFKFSIVMIIIDIFLYAFIGFFVLRCMRDDFRFHKVERKNIGRELGAKLTGVSKIYEGSDPNKPAVDNVSIAFKKNEVSCLLGRNGAGKSTIIKLLTGQIAPSFGEVALPPDYDLITAFKNPNEQIGLCPNTCVLLPNLTAKEHLELYVIVKMIKEGSDEVRRVLARMQLGEYKNFKAFELSGGYKRRLCIAIAFLGSPNLVILDEPCSGVDTHARKTIWELIGALRKNRAVVLATHDLDEAQHLGDSIIIMKDGRVALKSTIKDLQNELTQNFTINVELKASLSFDKDLANDVKEAIISQTLKAPADITLQDCNLTAVVPYIDSEGTYLDHSNLFRALEKLQSDKRILSFNVISKTLDELYKRVEDQGVVLNENGNIELSINNNNIMETIDLKKTVKGLQSEHQFKSNNEKTSLPEIIRSLFWKRFLHFRRNYKLMICILVLPVIFEIIAMGFMKIRPPGDYDKAIEFNRGMYPGSTEFYSEENLNSFSESVYEDFEETCAVNENCKMFESSRNSFDWLLKTQDDFIGKRYGGISLNNSRSIVWYNNKGYHSMPLYLNLLNSAILRQELNDSSYNIKTINHPLTLEEEQLSVSTILQEIADSGIALILLVSFSLVISGASVYIVNERISGEKLQQKLAGVSFNTYWGVAYIWDFIVYIVAVILAVIVFKIFNIPVYVERDNLSGIVLLLILYGFATIPAVHLFEKVFREASFANMSIFCVNVVVALSTVGIIVLFDVFAETDNQEKTRHFLNRLFLIFPQHALADGLIQICKNHIVSKTFIRFYINTYKSPVTSDLLELHFIALIVQGIFFSVANYIVESGIVWRIFYKQPKRHDHELSVVTIQNSLTKNGKVNEQARDALRVENVFKSYDGNRYAVNNVSFRVAQGSCYGLLGANGAGKSSIFSILSGETKRFNGTVNFTSKIKNSISYCPQTNALDMLLTVEEIIHFYGKLRNIKDLKHLTKTVLESFHLKPYKNILVKNLSGGNRRKLSVACASFGDLSLVLMDEPTSDMDPLTRNLVYKTIHELNDNNCSVILTSHSVAEIEQLCHSVGILVDGSIHVAGAPESLMKQFGNRYIVTMLSETPFESEFETNIRKTFRTLTNLMCHHYSARFTVQVKDFGSSEQRNMNLSELMDSLNEFSSSKNLKYTITSCQLDEAYDTIIKKGINKTYENKAFLSNE